MVISLELLIYSFYKIYMCETFLNIVVVGWVFTSFIITYKGINKNSCSSLYLCII
jgi:hypothetical protein